MLRLQSDVDRRALRTVLSVSELDGYQIGPLEQEV
jgi:hypothetical protein